MLKDGLRWDQFSSDQKWHLGTPRDDSGQRVWIRSSGAFGPYGISVYADATLWKNPASPTYPTATTQHRTHAHVSGRELETLPRDLTWRRVTW